MQPQQTVCIQACSRTVPGSLCPCSLACAPAPDPPTGEALERELLALRIAWRLQNCGCVPCHAARPFLSHVSTRCHPAQACTYYALVMLQHNSQQGEQAWLCVSVVADAWMATATHCCLLCKLSYIHVQTGRRTQAGHTAQAVVAEGDGRHGRRVRARLLVQLFGQVAALLLRDLSTPHQGQLRSSQGNLARNEQGGARGQLAACARHKCR